MATWKIIINETLLYETVSYARYLENIDMWKALVKQGIHF